MIKEFKSKEVNETKNPETNHKAKNQAEKSSKLSEVKNFWKDTFSNLSEKNELPKNIELVVKNTICQSTEIRQKETEKMSKEVDCIIIIGGKNSSNTIKLYDIAKQYCETAILVENAEELNLERIKHATKVGVMAGASTPKDSIDAVVKKLSNFAMKNIEI